MAAVAGPVAVAPRRPVYVVVPLAVVIIAVLAVFGYALAHGISAGRTNLLVGRQAPAFSYTTFDGQQVSLDSLKGSPIVVNFWGSWCVPCKDEAPVLQQAWARYQNTGVRFVGMAIWDKDDAARQFAQSAGAVWTNGLDPDGKIAIDYGVYGVPETFFIDRSGVLADRYVGPFVGPDGASNLDRYVQKLMAR